MSTDPSSAEDSNLSSSDEKPSGDSWWNRPRDASQADAPVVQAEGAVPTADNLAVVNVGSGEGHKLFHSFPAPRFADDPAEKSGSDAHDGIQNNHRNNNQDHDQSSLPATRGPVLTGQVMGVPSNCSLGDVASTEEITDPSQEHNMTGQDTPQDEQTRTISVDSAPAEQVASTPTESGAPGFVATSLVVCGGALMHSIDIAGQAMTAIGHWIVGPGLTHARNATIRLRIWASRDCNFSASRGASVAMVLGVVGMAFGTGLLMNWISNPVEVSVQPMNGGRPILTAIDTVSNQRVVGLNYLVVKSYQDRAVAEKTREQLVRSGIPCTVERGLSGFTGPSWYSVVGLSGFETVGRDAQYEQVMRSLRGMRFDPQPYKWRDDRYASVPLD